MGVPSAIARAVVKAAYDGAQSGRRLAGWVATALSPKRESQSNDAMVRRSRDLYRNNALVRAIIDRLVADVVGGGIGARPHASLRKQLREKMVTEFEDWAQANEFYALQAAAFKEFLIAGEALLVRTDLPYGYMWPCKWRLYECAHLPKGEKKTAAGMPIIDGIEYDASGEITAYHLFPVHPGEGGVTLKTVRFEASRVIHLFQADRPGQHRGVCRLAPVLVRAKLLDDFDDAVLERQKISNLFVGSITKALPEFDLRDFEQQNAAPDDSALNDAALDDADAPDIQIEDDSITVEPGAVNDLAGGEKLEWSDPPDPPDYEGFTRPYIKLTCAAMGVPPFLITYDFNDINDRTARVSMTAYRRSVEQIQNLLLIPKLVRPMRTSWIDGAVLHGTLPSNMTLRDLHRTDYVAEAWAYIHPVQDVDAIIKKIDSKLTSRSRELLKLGVDIEEIDAEIAREAEAMKSAKL